jgi:molecular chaperone DnaJ
VARRDYYATLGVRRNASTDEIRKAFRTLALKHHPDRNPDDAEAERAFREIAEAWEVLGDPEKRSRYDRLGPLYTPSGRPPSADEVNDMLRDALGGLFRKRRPGGPGEDLRHTLSVTLEEAATGCEKTIIVTRTVRCKTCDGTGDATEGRKPCEFCKGTGRSATRRLFRSDCAYCSGKGYVAAKKCERCGGDGRHPFEDRLKVRVPPGVATGQKLKLRNKGDEPAGTGEAGDLYVLVNVEGHPLFRRRGADLLCEVPVTFTEAALGSDLHVPTLTGNTTIRIPAGTPSGKTFRLAGRGLPTLDGTGRGDLHVKVILEVPPALSADQRAALASFAERLGPDAHPRRRAFDETLRSRP